MLKWILLILVIGLIWVYFNVDVNATVQYKHVINGDTISNKNFEYEHLNSDN